MMTMSKLNVFLLCWGIFFFTWNLLDLIGGDTSTMNLVGLFVQAAMVAIIWHEDKVYLIAKFKSWQVIVKRVVFRR